MEFPAMYRTMLYCAAKWNVWKCGRSGSGSRRIFRLDYSWKVGFATEILLPSRGLKMPDSMSVYQDRLRKSTFPALRVL
jgi:hypothetical protein